LYSYWWMHCQFFCSIVIPHNWRFYIYIPWF
jgi:hypothetical protein